MMRCVIDTDAGPDDLMALAYLLACPKIKVEAITTAYGLAHTHQGAANILRVLALCGRTDIPVYVGQDRPLGGGSAFPSRWRQLSDTLPGVSLPSTEARPERLSAATFLQRRVRHGTESVQILALGALTNIAALCDVPCPLLMRTVIMGGAFGVAGNVHDSGALLTRTAEWNMHVDPQAACAVFSSDLALFVVPLDATNQVPITARFIDHFAALRPSPLQRLTNEILAMIRPYATKGTYYAWDPLAAATMVDPTIVSTRRHPVAVALPCGTTRAASAGPPKTIAVSADGTRWQDAFCSAFAGLPLTACAQGVPPGA